jgi:RNA polymerase sigma-70 factor (ECF subfamily)
VEETPGFETVLRASWAPTVRYLRAVASAHLDIEDLAARSFEIAWRRRSELDDPANLLTWLLTIARNVALNGERGDRRLQRLRAKLAASRDPSARSEEAHQSLLDAEPGPATRALASMSRSEREVLVLHAWEELDAAAIGRVLGISRDAAAQRLSRARRRLQALISDMEEDG